MLGYTLEIRANWMINAVCHVVVAFLFLCGARCNESYLLCSLEDSHVSEAWCRMLLCRDTFLLAFGAKVLYPFWLLGCGVGFDCFGPCGPWFRWESVMIFVPCAVRAALLDMGCLLTVAVLQLYSRMFDDAIRFAAWAKIIAFVDLVFWRG